MLLNSVPLPPNFFDSFAPLKAALTWMRKGQTEYNLQQKKEKKKRPLVTKPASLLWIKRL